MQWRLAVGGVFGYFATFLFTPVMFQYYGPAVAGRMGMTWQLVVMLQLGALAWVHTRVPLFGRLLAHKDYRELDRVFFRLTWISQVIVTTGAVAAWLGVWTLGYLQPSFASRLLDPFTTALLLLAVVLYHFPQCQAFYIRAHKKELLMPISITSSILIGLSVWWFGKEHGPTGAAAAYLVIVGLVIVPWQTRIWARCRHEHRLDCPPEN
jgi:hypothetical protein